MELRERKVILLHLFIVALIYCVVRESYFCLSAQNFNDKVKNLQRVNEGFEEVS